MRFIQYILISGVCFWFILASLFLYRYSWGLKKNKHLKAPLTEFGMKYADSAYKDRFFTFSVEGSPIRFGIKRRDNKAYNKVYANFHVGDTIDLYYGDYRHVEGDVNFQIVDMKIKDRYVVNIKDREKRDLIAASFLYAISFLLMFWLWWVSKGKSRFVNQKTKNIPAH